MPGQGKSSANNTGYSIAKYADLIIKFCAELAINKASIIGLNNGASIAIEVAIMNPALIKHLILIDPPLFMDNNFVDEIKNFIQQLNGKNLNDFIEQLVAALFIKSSEKNKKIATQVFKNASVPTLIAIFNDLIEWNKTCDEKVKQLTSSTLCILTDEHHCSHEQLKACNNKIVIGRVVGSRCWATLEVPEQVNAMILRFVELM